MPGNVNIDDLSPVTGHEGVLLVADRILDEIKANGEKVDTFIAKFRITPIPDTKTLASVWTTWLKGFIARGKLVNIVQEQLLSGALDKDDDYETMRRDLQQVLEEARRLAKKVRDMEVGKMVEDMEPVD